jgi:antitoxin FitA
MAQLIVRNLDEAIVARLRQRAAKHGRSTEAEHREILREALLSARQRRSLKEHLLAMPEAGRDDDFARRQERPRKAVRL